uniref:Putative focal adhesion protein pinch-1 n=1 Tax=Nyssomyia neivai TaxID=330878 RepID=A0A1L8DMD9_9DIPT
MDRSMYGKIDPGARQPYRCTVREGGILPGYALLADLQNSVPGATQQHHYNANSSGGYGSLRSKQSPQSPTYHSNGAVRGSGSLPRNVGVGNTTGNLSELDSLLEDLSSQRYGRSLDRKGENGYTSSRYVNDSTVRPSVDSLLDELSSANTTGITYAVPNGTSTPEPGVKPGKHVTITVRETKTERMRSQSPPGVPDVMETVTKEEKSYSSSTPSFHASSATKELDDLMASLSDFKVNSNNHRHQTVTDYAKPNKGVSHIQQYSQVTTTTTTTNHPRDQLDSMLGNLQANMNRQGVTTTQKGCCSGCDKPIVGQVITALGKTWHPEHFTCNHCNQELGTRNFFERDGNPYCEPDYHNLFSPRCAYCNGAILDKCVTALEKTWHTEHFFCAQCGQQFGEEGFHERDGKPYCRSDYFDMFAPKCSGCNRAIMENYISALNAQWHPSCFVCRDCRQPFQGGSFFDHEGLPYCETHYHAKRGSLCAGCSKPITGRCITAMFRKFHPEHFVCAFCLKQLNKGTFKEQNDKPYCHPCFDKLFG